MLCSPSDDDGAGSVDLALRAPPAKICLFPRQGNWPEQGPPSLSQDLDLRGSKLCLGTLPFLVRTEDKKYRPILFGGVLQEHRYLTSRTKDLIPRSLQQLTTPLPHLSYKRSLLTAFREFGVFVFVFVF